VIGHASLYRLPFYDFLCLLSSEKTSVSRRLHLYRDSSAYLYVDASFLMNFLQGLSVDQYTDQERRLGPVVGPGVIGATLDHDVKGFKLHVAFIEE